ncbi:uncharacterized protein LOC124952022 [Vespa velutina]|uniref:uncharacterized protein LOC124952022 n=1 Tax=Vespa velutina TaxID=202808 RepID=UPI001FB24A03|nr:uncharacterized protein LOC124952022 [Vespa velutina]XP_047357263.1 uncharacterized protein LOC124952022 [Vespa velutina]XP_047357264.1 uncharacterized protein LOC124952022 [Vespa velutina]
MQTGPFLRFLMIFIYLHRASTRETNVESITTTIDFEPATETADIQTGTAVQSYRRSRYYRRGYNKKPEDDVPDYMDDHDDHDDHSDHDEEDDHGDMKAISQPKVDYWAGYYDFLINEGSYKFWAVFQLATAALLIYSGFAALYYAKVNPPTTDEDYDDIFRRRRRKRYALSPSAIERPFSGLDDVTFQRILDAVAREIH